MGNSPRAASPGITPVVFIITLRAFRHIRDANTWWHENRASPSPILEDVHRAIQLLKLNPESGTLVETKARASALRRVILPQLNYHLYYRVNASRSRLELLAFWHERRMPPRL